MKKTTLLLILLTAVCVNAEYGYTFDNDKNVQERESKRDEEREQARKALERVRWGVKAGWGGNGAIVGGEAGIMLNIPYSRLANGNLQLATELNGGFRWGDTHHSNPNEYEEIYLNIPLVLQYVSFYYPTTDIQVHWVPSPKRHFYMHLKTIAEAGVFIDIPFGTTVDPSHKTFDINGDLLDGKKEDCKDRNFFDLGVMLGGAVQLESIILGARVAASYTDFTGSSYLFLQAKAYLGYLF